jgi:hypothetical protein
MPALTPPLHAALLMLLANLAVAGMTVGASIYIAQREAKVARVRAVVAARQAGPALRRRA